MTFKTWWAEGSCSKAPRAAEARVTSWWIEFPLKRLLCGSLGHPSTFSISDRIFLGVGSAGAARGGGFGGPVQPCQGFRPADGGGDAHGAAGLGVGESDRGRMTRKCVTRDARINRVMDGCGERPLLISEEIRLQRFHLERSPHQASNVDLCARVLENFLKLW